MQEINGFKIEKYNQYGIPENAKYHTCPLCSHNRNKKKDKCLSVFWDTGLGKCNHCGESVQLHTYQKKTTEVKRKEYNKPEKFKYSKLSQGIIDYFKKRGISEQTLAWLKVTESEVYFQQIKSNAKSINFNYFIDDKLVNIKYRDGNKNFKLYSGAELVMYNLDSIRISKECVIVEGEIDALSFVEAGYYSVVSVPNGFTIKGDIKLDYLDDYMGYFLNKEKIYLCLDNDEAGKRGTEAMIRRFGAEKCFLCDLNDFKDANEVLVAKGGEGLLEVLKNAKLAPLENVITILDLENQIYEFWENGLTRGILIGSERFDDIYSLAWGQYTMVTGVPQSGKSEFLDYMICRYSALYGEKTAFCSIENEPFIFHYNKLFMKFIGSKPKDYRDESVRNTIDYINNNFYHVQMNKRYCIEDVLEKFGEIYKRKGVRIFVIDPYNKVRLKKPTRDLIADTIEYHNLLDDFVKTYNCHLFLVAHPVKTKLQEGSNKTYVMPDAYSIKGGGEHFDMSYNMLAVNRLYENRLVHVKTLKVKFIHLGSPNEDVFFSYNSINGRYEDLEFQPDNIIQGMEYKPKTLDMSNWLVTPPSLVSIKKPYLIIDNQVDLDFFGSSNYEEPPF